MAEHAVGANQRVSVVRTENSYAGGHDGGDGLTITIKSTSERHGEL